MRRADLPDPPDRPDQAYSKSVLGAGATWAAPAPAPSESSIAVSGRSGRSGGSDPCRKLETAIRRDLPGRSTSWCGGGSDAGVRPTWAESCRARPTRHIGPSRMYEPRMGRPDSHDAHQTSSSHMRRRVRRPRITALQPHRHRHSQTMARFSRHGKARSVLPDDRARRRCESVRSVGARGSGKSLRSVTNRDPWVHRMRTEPLVRSNPNKQ